MNHNGLLKRIGKQRFLLCLMIPGLLYYLIYQYLPMFGLVVAFQDYNLLKGVWGSSFVGLENFKVVFTGADFPVILKNTVILSVYRILFNMFPDVILALILNEVRISWFKRTVQTITYGPHFLSWIIIYGITFSFLAPGSGLITGLFRDYWGVQLDLLTDPDVFRSILITTDIWKNTGWGAIIYLAALSTINPELYQAAAVDGGGRWRQMWHVTLPGIRNVFVLLIILRMGHILDAGFEQVYIFMNTRVYEVADIIDTWVFRYGLERLEFSVAASVGLFKSVVGFIMVLLANNLAKRWGEDGIW